MENLLVFVVIGLLVGAASRLLFPGRQVTRILGTMLIGMIGALVGGLISWSCWPAVEGEYHTGNLIMSAIGGMLTIGLWSGVGYARSLSNNGITPR